MEAGGFAVGVIALASLFNNAVDCFEYIQIGRNFGTNFQTCLLKLDNARLRLSRWGQAAGLSGNVEDTQSLQQGSLSAEDIPKAEKILGQVLDLFADAEGVSAKFKIRASPNDTSLALYDQHKELDSLGMTLHDKMRTLSLKRQNRTQLRQKVKWALYEEKHFRRLIDDITELVNSLVDLFPALQTMQRELCVYEVSEFGDGGLPVLKDIAKDQDKELEEAILKALEHIAPKTSQNTWNNYNSKIVEQVETKHVHGNQTINM